MSTFLSPANSFQLTPGAQKIRNDWHRFDQRPTASCLQVGKLLCVGNTLCDVCGNLIPAAAQRPDERWIPIIFKSRYSREIPLHYYLAVCSAQLPLPGCNRLAVVSSL